MRQYITMSVIRLPIFIYQRRFKPGGFHNRIFTYTTTVVQWGYRDESSIATAAPKKPCRSDSTRTVLWPSHCMPHTYTQCLILVHLNQICQKQAYIWPQNQKKEMKHYSLLQESAVYFRTIKRLCIMIFFKHISKHIFKHNYK